MGDVLNVNRHFAAQYTQCPFCSLPYDLVGKKETFDKDIQILFENLELTDICDTNLAQNKAKNQGQEEDNTLQFFSQIPKSMSRKIFDYYKLDFDLFGYEKMLSSTIVISETAFTLEYTTCAIGNQIKRY